MIGGITCGSRLSPGRGSLIKRGSRGRIGLEIDDDGSSVESALAGVLLDGPDFVSSSQSTTVLARETVVVSCACARRVLEVDMMNCGR
jgi:hypothetical protein